MSSAMRMLGARLPCLYRASVQHTAVQMPRICCPSLARSSKRFYSEPAPEEPAVEVSPKIRSLVDDISGLTLLEVADLTAVLKKELNIADAALAFAPAGGAAPGAADAGEAEDDAPKGPALVKVTLTGFKADSKIKVIKEIKTIMAPADPKFNLAAAKKFVEGAPSVLKEDISPEEADKLKEALEAIGGEIKLE